MAGRIQPLRQQSPPPPPAPDTPTAATPLTADYKSETQRAYREARTAITLLQQRWPAAFPQTPQQVRPLITRLTSLIAEAGGSVKEITHDRLFSGPNVAAVNVLCTVETRDQAHIEELYRHLTANGVRHFSHLGRE